MVRIEDDGSGAEPAAAPIAPEAGQPADEEAEAEGLLEQVTATVASTMLTPDPGSSVV